MPEKSLKQRAARAKAKGTTMILKETDVGIDEGISRHAEKKSRGIVGQYKFADRSVSPRATTGRGNTARSKKLPVPETGSSSSRRRTLPAEAAAQHRKDAPRKSRTAASSSTPRRRSVPRSR